MGHSFGETLCFRGAPWLWVLARRAILRGAATLGQCRDALQPQECFQALPFCSDILGQCVTIEGCCSGHTCAVALQSLSNE